MLEHWLIELVGHVSGLSDAQLQQIEKSSPATKELFAASRAAMSGEFLKPGLEYPR
jgi:hypothetical protein